MKRLITGGTVVTEQGAQALDLVIEAGRIVGLHERGSLSADGHELIDATGLIVMPGAIDVHTHFTGPHDFPEEELREGTLGASIGGITTIIEMPHSDPPATSPTAFRRKRALLEANSTLDFGLWAGLTNDNAEDLAELDALGASAFKAFLTSGNPTGEAPDKRGLPQMKDSALLTAMRRIREFGGLIGVHAENHELLLQARLAEQAAGRHDASAHAASAPEIAEVEAVSRLLLYAAETGVRCHVVHVSSPKAAELIRRAKADGVAASFESCPHYLILDEEDLIRIGPDARCGPPLRPRPTVDALWQHALQGGIDMLSSDHCPYLPEQKRAGDESIWEAGMGLTGVETLGPMFFSEAVAKRGMSLETFALMTATAPARLMGLYPRKGAIRVGGDADLALYDPQVEWTVRGERFRGLAPWSAFEGMACRGSVVRTLVRGIDVQVVGKRRLEPGQGRFVTRHYGRGIDETAAKHEQGESV